MSDKLVDLATYATHAAIAGMWIALCAVVLAGQF
jgi:hypothetical protein